LISKLHRRLFATPSAALRRRWRLAFIAIAAGIVLASPAALAADEPVTLNFVNADIDAVIKAVAEITGRNFIVDPKVKGTINIISARPVPRSLVYPTLLSALRLQGFAAIEGDEVVKIVPEADAKQQAGTITTGRVTTGGDRLVTQVITLKKDELPQRAPELFAQTGPYRLVLVTCGGQWVGGKIGYASNQIIIALPNVP